MKKTITIQRLSSFTLLKLLLLGGAVFWVLYVFGSFIYLVVVGDLNLPYSVGGVDKVASLATGVKVFFILAALVVFADLFLRVGYLVSSDFWFVALFEVSTDLDNLL